MDKPRRFGPFVNREFRLLFAGSTISSLKPFMWTATADSILAKLEHLGKVICGTSH
jgi:hypothetical protein